MIVAKNDNIDLDWDTACAIDLSGRDVLHAVQTSTIDEILDKMNHAPDKSTEE